MELSHVSFGYPGKPLFRDVSLSLLPGERLAVMGPSGCGKTTLLRLMAGLEKPTAGTVTGIPKEGVSMVFQENRLVPGMTVLENLSLVAPKAGQEELMELLRPLGLEAEGDSYPDSLSGGMARRVAIARAAALGSPLALLDEPFTGLDETARRAAAEFILDRFPHASLVASIHHPEESELLHARVVELSSLTLQPAQTPPAPGPRRRCFPAGWR